MSHIAPCVPVSGSSDRSQREDHEAQVVDAHPAEHVAEPAQRDDEHRLDEQVPDDHPEQVAHVARGERVQADAAEDGRHRDDHDGRVDRRHRHAQRGVGQGDPPVPVRPPDAGAGDRGRARRSSSRYAVHLA
jgi:hypothetical protein